MSKIGVGVGEEFPVDETKPAETGAAGSQSDETRCRGSREDRDKMRSEWREKKRAFKDEMRRRWHENFGEDYHHHHHRVVYVALAP